MKKLIIGFAALAVSIAANAATYSWTYSLPSGFLFDGTGGTAKIADNTSVYLMFTSAYSFSDIVSDFAASGIDTSKAIASTSISGGKFSASSASADVVGDQTAYLAIVYKDRLFISTTANAEAWDVGASSIAFDSQSYLTRYNNTASTLLPDNQASAGYSGAGWYAVPEPTSGLLLLLGVAGLALKRKRV